MSSTINNMSNILYKKRIAGGKMNNRVRELRARYGYSQEALAKAVGVTRQTVAAIEKGNYIPSLLLALKICGEFRLNMEEVFWLEGGKNE